MVQEARAAYNDWVDPDHRSRWARRGAALLLLAPFLLLAGVTGERTARDAGWIDETADELADAEGELLPGRLLLYSATAAEVRVFSLEGKRVGRLRSSPPAAVQGLPLRDGDWLLYLAGPRQSPVSEAYLGRVPREGEHLTRRFRLPDRVPLQFLDGHPSELHAPWPLAVRCGEEILLRLERGWARLALGPGRSYRRGPRLPLAPKLEGEPPRACRALRALETGQRTPIEHALLDEIWRDRDPYLLGAPRLPPPYLVLVGPDRRRERLLRPPAGSSVPGSAYRSGRHVLFHGRACDLGEERLTLCDLEDPARRTSLWSAVVPVPREGCRPGPLEARLCGEGSEQAVAIGAGGRVSALRVSDGAATSAPGPGERCAPFRALRRDGAAWEAARTLDVGTSRYRIEAAGGEVVLSAREARVPDRPPRYRVRLDAPAYLLGATEDALLLIADEILEVRDRSSGALRARQRLAPLRGQRGEPPPSTRFIGSEGRRGYFLIFGESARLLLFDGARARFVR